MRVMIYDTETTGLPEWGKPSEDPCQPHIVQIGGILFDLGSRQIINRMDVVVRPLGWKIPEDVVAVHGITTEMAEAVGVPEEDAIGMLMAFWDCAEKRVAHNESFDARILRIGLMRYPDLGVDPDGWKAGEADCTAQMASPIMKMPPTEKMIKARRGGQFKTPKLVEAYKHFFGEEMSGAHSAYADAEGCLRLYLHLLGDTLPLATPRPRAEDQAAPKPAIPEVPAKMF